MGVLIDDAAVIGAEEFRSIQEPVKFTYLDSSVRRRLRALPR
jgi:hypothetical protein